MLHRDGVVRSERLEKPAKNKAAGFQISFDAEPATIAIRDLVRTRFAGGPSAARSCPVVFVGYGQR